MKDSTPFHGTRETGWRCVPFLIVSGLAVAAALYHDRRVSRWLTAARAGQAGEWSIATTALSTDAGLMLEGLTRKHHATVAVQWEGAPYRSPGRAIVKIRATVTPWWFPTTVSMMRGAALAMTTLSIFLTIHWAFLVGTNTWKGLGWLCALPGAVWLAGWLLIRRHFDVPNGPPRPRPSS